MASPRPTPASPAGIRRSTWPPSGRIWRRIAADEGALYWDWHGFMGGDCSIHAWSYADPPLAQRDHILLTEAGYRRSADALFQQLLTGLNALPAAAAEPVAETNASQ